MTVAGPDRLLPDRYVRIFFQAVEEQMGKYSLHMMLRQASLERCIEQLSLMNRPVSVYSSELAQFQGAIRAYYGRGARGTLNRIGRRIFHFMVEDSALFSRTHLIWIRLLSGADRRRKCLDFLAGQLREPNGEITIQPLGLDLVFIVHSSDTAFGQSASEPICWVTQGMIQEALLWANQEEPDVEEVCCQAAGGETCTFRIYAADR